MNMFPHLCGGFLTRTELLSIHGHAYVHVFYKADGKWVPLQPDDSRKKKKLGGMAASGFVVAPSAEKGIFRLEVPRQGNLSKIFLRVVKEGSVPTMHRRPGYRDEPFVMFVDNVLCIRDVPKHAIVSNQLADSGWERLQLSSPTNFGMEELGSVQILSYKGNVTKYDAMKNRFAVDPSARKFGGDVLPAVFAFEWYHDSDHQTCPRWICRAFSSCLRAILGAQQPQAEEVVDVVTAEGNLFEVVGRTVVEESTGEVLEADVVRRGTVRIETLSFMVRAPLTNLKRSESIAKHFGMIWHNVGLKTVDMGSWHERAVAQEFTLPRAEIPNMALAKGKYRVTITYEAENFDAPLHRDTAEFEIH